MLLEIQRIGTPDWPRYCLVARDADGCRFWEGTAWEPDIESARLYAFLPEACQEFERLKSLQLGEPAVQEFEATITVKLHAHQSMNEQELAKFLDRFAELFLPTAGPHDDSLIQAEIHWHRLRKRQPQESREQAPDDSSEKT